MTYLDQNVTGKGLKFSAIGSVFTARVAVAVGDIAMVTEGATVDDAAVSGGINGSDTGTLANTVAVGTNAGLGTVLGWFVLATEAAAVGQPFRGLSEGYNVLAKVTTAGALAARGRLYATTANVLNDSAPGIQSPVSGRLLSAIGGAQTATLTAVHFRGCPGGFAVGAGTT